MAQLKNLLVVSERYPVEGEPVFTFLDELLVALNSLGVNITVISPQSATRLLFRNAVKTPRKWLRTTSDGGFWIHQPRYISLSNKLKCLRSVNLTSYRRAVRRAALALDGDFDACYAHFWHSAVAAGLALPDKPLFVACGEHKVKPELAGDVRLILKSVKGVVSVSSVNKRDCAQIYGVSPDIVEIIPNAVDTDLFFPRNDRDCTRRELGLSDGDMAIAFVGWFDERKGVKRLEAALKGLEDVKAVYIGYGAMVPTGDNIAYCARTPHDEIPRLLSACDAFALPTRAEGCCNAIVEAMACGLPIISSDREFNDDILNDNNSLRVDPDDVDAIRRAVVILRDDEALREKLARGSLESAKELGIRRRAQRIKEHIENRI
ncbi:MAG: glycosyltransferase [Clostridia bacterium]|nr:glycosyltransferase [Clostridia bacterium]